MKNILGYVLAVVGVGLFVGVGVVVGKSIDWQKDDNADLTKEVEKLNAKVDSIVANNDSEEEPKLVEETSSTKKGATNKSTKPAEVKPSTDPEEVDPVGDDDPSDIDLNNNTTKDNKVLNKLKEILNTIKNGVQDGTYAAKAKDAITTVVDFLFYDGEIAGVTFDELSDDAKEKALNLAIKIDDAIEERVPGYKTKILINTLKGLTAVRNAIVAGANKVDDFLQDKLTEEQYDRLMDKTEEAMINTAKAIVKTVKTSKNVIENTKENLNDWYENWKNK